MHFRHREHQLRAPVQQPARHQGADQLFGATRRPPHGLTDKRLPGQQHQPDQHFAAHLPQPQQLHGALEPHKPVASRSAHFRQAQLLHE